MSRTRAGAGAATSVATTALTTTNTGRIVLRPVAAILLPAIPGLPTITYMLCSPSSTRRTHPRISVETLCSEHHDTGERPALILDLSEDGLRIQRPIGGPRTRTLQLEFEIPEIDELVWATGHVCFDQVWRVPATDAVGLSGVLRTTGIRLVAAATHHRRLLREYVNDAWGQLRAEVDDRADSEWMFRAACYLRA
jgi:hypothetical protein